MAIDAGPSYHRKKDRFNSFQQGWNHQYKPPVFQLVEAGFYKNNGRGNPSDNVRCAFCGLEISNWNHNENPFAAHRQYSPTCAYVIKKQNKCILV